MVYPYWPYFYGIFYEIFIEDNYRIDGLKDVKNIVDVGANTGVSAVYFAQTYPHASIDCFEPNPEAVQYLRKNVAAYPRVTVHPYALGEKEGSIPFFVDSEIAGSSIAGRVNLFTGKRRSAREIQVEMRILSSFITEPVDILKIDIEGGEWSVLTDLVSSGALKKVKTLLMEYHYDPNVLSRPLSDVLTLLSENHFFTYVRKGSFVAVAEPVTHGCMLFAFNGAFEE